MLATPLGQVLKTINFKYDPLGRRVSKTVLDSVDDTKSFTKKFIYDGDNIIAELDSSNRLVASYTHSPLRPDDILAVHFTNNSVKESNGGTALSDAYEMAPNVGNYYYLKDHLNTVGDIVDSVGNIVQRYDYTAYGVVKSVKNAAGSELGYADAPIRTSFAFTGREYESELGIYYYRARYYDPTNGRFLQKDSHPGYLMNPLTTVNKYAYAGNNPILLNDPSGKSWLSDFVEGGRKLIQDFGTGFDLLVKNPEFQKLLVIAVAATVAWIAAPAIVAAFGLASSSVVFSVTITALWGAVVGGVIGGLGYTTFGLGTFKEGFQAGAIAGAVAGGLNYGTSGLSAALSTSSPNLAVRITAYGIQLLGVAEPLVYIPTVWSCNDLSSTIGTSGVTGACHD